MLALCVAASASITLLRLAAARLRPGRPDPVRHDERR